MKIRTFLFTLLLGLALVSPVTAQAPDDQTVRNEFLGLQLAVPPDWFVGDSYAEDRLFLASDQPGADQAVLMVSRLPGLGRTLETFDKTTQNFVYTKMNGYLNEEAHITVDGAPAYLMVYEGDSKVEENGWRLFYRVVAEKDGDFVVFHGVMDPKEFSRYRGTFESIVKSVRWNNLENS